jgi:hypothetical protein
MKGTPYVAFVPWVIFGLVSRGDTLKAACVAALAAAIVIGIPSFLRRSPKLLEIATMLAFAAFTIVAFAANPGHNSVLERYARVFAAGALCLIAFGSLLATPFTEQYAREIVPREFWETERFKRTNVVFTAAWGAAFAAITVSHVVAGAIDTRRAMTIFNWVVPIATIVAMFNFMERYRKRDEPAASRGESG